MTAEGTAWIRICARLRRPARELDGRLHARLCQHFRALHVPSASPLNTVSFHKPFQEGRRVTITWSPLSARPAVPLPFANKTELIVGAALSSATLPLTAELMLPALWMALTANTLEPLRGDCAFCKAERYAYVVLSIVHGPPALVSKTLVAPVVKLLTSAVKAATPLAASVPFP